MADKIVCIRPRRGNKSTMSVTPKSSIILEEGEMFVEFDDNEPDIRKRHARVKIGDGTNSYASLPYAWGNAVEDEAVDFLEDHRDSFAAVFADLKTGIAVNALIPLIKRCIYLLQQAEASIVTNVYDKTEVYNKIESDLNYYNKTDTYSKTEVNDNFYKKDDVYTKSEINSLLADYYKKTETYSNTEVYNKTETYTKSEVDNLVLVDVRNSDPSNPQVGQQWIINS